MDNFLFFWYYIMPFTLSHASIILPLNRKPFILSALIIGSFSPDFPYFIPSFGLSYYSHSLIGIVYFTLPAGCFSFIFFHNLILRSFKNILPNHLGKLFISGITKIKCEPYYILRVLISLLIGILTHLLWDSFTHKNGPAVLKYPVLSSVIFHILGEPIFIYKLLQYLSTIIGGLIFLYWINKKHKESELSRTILHEILKYSKTIFFLTTSSMIIGIVYGYTWLNNFGFKAFFVKSILAMISAFLLFIVLLSITLSFKDNKI